MEMHGEIHNFKKSKDLSFHIIHSGENTFDQFSPVHTNSHQTTPPLLCLI